MPTGDLAIYTPKDYNVRYGAKRAAEEPMRPEQVRLVNLSDHRQLVIEDTDNDRFIVLEPGEHHDMTLGGSRGIHPRLREATPARQLNPAPQKPFNPEDIDLSKLDSGADQEPDGLTAEQAAARARDHADRVNRAL